MGLIKAVISAASSTLADSWKDFFYCDSLSQNVLMQKGQARVSAGSSNTRRDENIITDGSRIVVNEGQCLLVVENGKIIDFSAEPGNYEWKSGAEPSMFSGGFKGLVESFKRFGERIAYGGQAFNDMRVYYVNTKEIMDNKIGIGDVPFRDSEFGFTIQIRGYGVYSYKITDPILFYTHIAGNVQQGITRAEVDEQMRAEVQQSMQPALGKIAAQGIAYDQLPNYTLEIAKELNAALTDSWVALRGISVVSVALASITPDDASKAKIAQFQESRIYTNTQMLGARLGTAQANAMESAANNAGGAMNGFIGMGMAMQAGGANAAQMFQMGQNGQAPPPIQPNQPGGAPTAPAPSGASPDTAPAAAQNTADVWTCPKCGTQNTGKFCTECGTPKPVPAKEVKCPNCGWVAPDPNNLPKFCPNCGNPFPQ